uniref:Uncharacterized protein n=1 Tax=Vitis vinifera TaxID=29760 RepID=A5AHB3_VITVI|nr:hypothetical protein VITISV_016269 [Vitis vinifera]
MQVSGVPYPPPRSGKTSVSKNYYYEDSSSSSWGFSDPEIKRRKRIALYKACGVEGKMKASLRGVGDDFVGELHVGTCDKDYQLAMVVVEGGDIFAELGAMGRSL